MSIIGMKRAWLLSWLIMGVAETGALYNSQEAPEKRSEYVVSLRNETGCHFCGGMLVEARYVITSAHCLYPDSLIFGDCASRSKQSGDLPRTLDPHNVTVLVGSLSSLCPLSHRPEPNSPTGRSYEALKFYLHPDFDITRCSELQNDIAIVELKENVTLVGVKPVWPSWTEPKPGSVMTIMGWGYVNEENRRSGTTSSKLRETTTVVNSPKVCIDSYSKHSTPFFTNETLKQYFEINKSLFCATPTVKGSGLCIRDSGTPALIADSYVGINTFGYGCASGVPDTYTPLKNYKKFIHDVIVDKKGLCCIKNRAYRDSLNFLMIIGFIFIFTFF